MLLYLSLMEGKEKMIFPFSLVSFYIFLSHDSFFE